MKLRTALPKLALAGADCWIDSWTAHRFGIHHLRAARAMSAHRGFVVLLWHQTLLSVCGTHRNLPLSALVSRSYDGTVLAEFLKRRGIIAVRGSKSRGGATASLELLQRLRAGFPVVSSIDGPRGPFKQPQAGIIDLARRAEAPIILVAARATSELTVRIAWDRVRVPLPRAHVAVCYGEPIQFPSEAPDEAETQRRRRLVASRLHDLEAEASRHAGQPDHHPSARDTAWMEGP